MKQNSRTRTRALRAIVLLVLAGLSTACLEDDTVEPPFVPEVGGELFTRYVSLGNSITAGFQSGGIHRLFQQQAYPVLLAERAGAEFGVPALNLPGCPPPLAAPLSGERTSEVACAYRDLNAPPLVQNLAVPGATVLDATDVTGPAANTLATLILGGLTQVEAMLAADPTLVSVWLGNNDALRAAMSGETALLTPVDVFEDAYGRIVDAIEETDAQSAILIGVANPIAIAPALQPGAYFWAVDQSGQEPVPLDVSANCAPGTPGGSRWVSFLVADPYLAGETESIQVDCGEDAPYLLTEEEAGTVVARVNAFNEIIAGAAEARDWIYVDPTAAFIGPALADPDLVRKCQGLATAQTEQEIMAAVQETCPHPEAPNFFGAYFTYDGVHPSSAAHVTIADTLAERLNDRFGLNLPTSD